MRSLAVRVIRQKLPAEWRRRVKAHDCRAVKAVVRCFSNKTTSEDWDGWIPPDRPLVEDQGQSHLYTRHKTNGTDNEEEPVTDESTPHDRPQLQENSEKDHPNEDNRSNTRSGPDWLRTRRDRLGATTEAIDMMVPGKAKSHKDDLAQIPIQRHTLLTKNEITTCLQALGGRDITVILDDPKIQRLGGALGLILVSASSHMQLCTLANALVKQMRRRDLHQMDVIGAQLGPEGSIHDKDSVETWLVVDCRNYIVHLQDDRTRARVNLEALWTGKDPLFQVDLRDEDAMDDYVAAYPVPDGYGQSNVEFDTVLKQLQKNRFTAPHRSETKPKKQSPRRR